MSKSPQSSIDKILNELSEDDYAEFMLYCRRANPTYSDLQGRLSELGYESTISSIQRWYIRNFPTGEQAKAVNALMLPYQGADSYAAMSMSLGITTQMIQSLFELLDTEQLELLKEKPHSVAYQLSILLKEQRVTAQAIQQQTTIRDRKSLELAGGYRVAELIKSLASQGSDRALIESLVHAAISQLEDEIARS